ncbi:uncharacterized protein EDB93DRAFT_1254668 [Suillus bovinus]|uniref:uncharacterized protein n=1 Tax=Suillus bovinus TaxID=48563 RepID=UPI001B874C44|nr:uncharacterized protein EDB93DRAFT_1254668 [Suillus bovinus]KAG2134059.1 hypothetical protein EDB93DRAFT_1254668 [Suillus bovinus]
MDDVPSIHALFPPILATLVIVVSTDDPALSAVSIDGLARPKCGLCVISAIWEATPLEYWSLLSKRPVPTFKNQCFPSCLENLLEKSVFTCIRSAFCRIRVHRSLKFRICQAPSAMPPKKTSSTKKCANPRMATPVVDFVMRTHSGVPINQRMLQTKMTLPPAKKIKPTPLPRGNSFMSFDDYSAILARHAKSSIATTEPPTDTESDTQDHPKTDDPVTDDEDNSEGQADTHKGNLVDDPKIHESSPPSDTPEDEDSSLNGAPSSENNYPYQNREARRQAEHRAMLAQHDPSSSEEGSDKDDEYTEDQDADKEKEEDDDDNDNEIPAPPSKAKLLKKRMPPKALPPKFTVTETPPSTQILQAAAHVTTKSVEKSAVSSALPKSSMAMETDDDNDLPITSRPGRLCQEGIDDAQELRRKTLHAAKIIGDKYGKSAHTILIEAGLSVKHSRVETPWNMHQGWYKGKYPRETDEELGDWRKRQRDHYYSLQDSDPLWGDIQAHYDCHLGGASNNRSRASIVMSTRDALAKRGSAWVNLRVSAGQPPPAPREKPTPAARVRVAQWVVKEGPGVQPIKGVPAGNKYYGEKLRHGVVNYSTII